MALKDYPNQFGKLLAQVRQDRGMAQGDFYELIGIAQSEISKYERGIILHPHPDKIRALANVLHYPVVNFALALINEPLAKVYYPEMEERSLPESLSDLLSLGPSEKEGEYLVQQLEMIRTWGKRVYSAEGNAEAGEAPSHDTADSDADTADDERPTASG